MNLSIITGDLLAQPVEAIANPWNRNWLPWWLLLPHGVSGAIKRRAGYAPFRELAAYGRMRPGQAVWTGAGRLPFRGIIHAATIGPFGRSDPALIAAATTNTLALAADREVRSLALPLFGSGSGGVAPERAKAIMLDALDASPFRGQIILTIYRP